MSETNVQATLDRVHAEAKARAKPETVSYGTLAPGNYHRQGDVYFVRLSRLPQGACGTQAPAGLQIAPGDGQGSRHCLKPEHAPHVEWYRRAEPTPLDGPVLKVAKGKTAEFTHPEHGHVVLPAGTYGIHYQRQYAEELRRVQD